MPSPKASYICFFFFFVKGKASLLLRWQQSHSLWAHHKSLNHLSANETSLVSSTHKYFYLALLLLFVSTIHRLQPNAHPSNSAQWPINKRKRMYLLMLSLVSIAEFSTKDLFLVTNLSLPRVAVWTRSFSLSSKMELNGFSGHHGKLSGSKQILQVRFLGVKWQRSDTLEIWVAFLSHKYFPTGKSIRPQFKVQSLILSVRLTRMALESHTSWWARPQVCHLVPTSGVT